MSDLEAITDEIRKAGPARKMKNLPEAFEESKSFTLEDVKQIQEEVSAMDVDSPEDDADEMDIDEDEESPSEEEKPKKRGTKRKKSESAGSDDEESDKPAKTPKKAAAPKARTPKSAPKTPKAKTPKSNGVKASAKKTPAPKKATTPATKKSTKAKKYKSEETVEDSEGEATGKSNTDDAIVDMSKLDAKNREEVMMHRRHRLQKVLLNKDGVVPENDVSSEKMVISGNLRLTNSHSKWTRWTPA